MNTARKITPLLFIMIILKAGSIQPVWAGPKYIPVVNGLFTTGQWYFEGDRSSLGGNANLAFVPALRFSNRFSLIPTLQSSYRGTRSAEELAGGNTLFQDTWENSIGIKAVHSFGKKWKVRERIGFRNKFYRETTDETLGDGLYDYQVYSGGAEVERLWSKQFTTALGYDYSILVFPNYVSLESSQGGDQAREFSGNDVLDNNIQLMTARTQVPFFFKMEPSLIYMYSPRHYTNQTVVNLSGLLTPQNRFDLYTAVNLSVDRMFRLNNRMNLLTNVFGSHSNFDSTQNHYDARLTTFIADYYDYDENKVGAQLSLALNVNKPGPIVFDLGGSYAHRNYRHRVTQSVDASYNSDTLYIIESSLNLGFSYPISKNFRIRTLANFGRSKSNNDYEELYRYNFNNANYQFGFSYAY